MDCHKNVRTIVFRVSISILLAFLFGCTTAESVDFKDESHKEKTKSTHTNKEALEENEFQSFAKLEESIEEGDIKKVRAILKIFDNVDISNEAGTTALHLSALWGQQEIVQMLLSMGADVSAKRRLQFTPLHFAAYEGNKTIIDALVRAGADLDAETITGSTALHIAVWKENKEAAKRLVYHGADIYAEKIDGTRPFDELNDTAAFFREQINDLRDDFEIEEVPVALRFGKQVKPYVEKYGPTVAQAIYHKGMEAVETGEPNLPPNPMAAVRIPRTFQYTEQPYFIVEVENKGKGSVYELTGLIEVEGGFLPEYDTIFIGKLEPGEKAVREVALTGGSLSDVGNAYPVRVQFEEANDYVPPDVAGKINISDVDNRVVQRTIDVFTVSDIRDLVENEHIDRRAVDRLIHFEEYRRRLNFSIEDIKFFCRRKAVSQDIVERLIVEELVPYSNKDLIDIAELNYVTRSIVESLFFEGRDFTRKDITRLTQLGVFSKPEVLFTYTINDGDSANSVGNRDGLIQVREGPDFNFVVKNNSTFKLEDVRFTLESESEYVDVFNNRQEITGFESETTETLTSTVALKSKFSGKALKLHVKAENPLFGTLLDENLNVPVGKRVGSSIIALNKKVVSTDAIDVYSGADTHAPLLSTLEEGAVFDVVGELEGFYKVSIFDQYGWILKELTTEKRESTDRKYTLVSDISEEKRIYTNLKPEVVIESPQNNDSIDHNRTQLRVTAVDQANKISSIAVRVNGELLQGSTERGLKVTSTENTRVNRSFDLRLQKGKNSIEVTAWNDRNIASPPQRITVFSTGMRNPPRLFVLSVGVNDYVSSEWNLRYPVADAREVAKIFQSQEGVLYEEVFTKTLTNGEADRQSILRELREFVYKARSTDVVLIFMAGHGIQSKGSYFFMAHGSDLNRPALDSISEEELKKELLYNIDSKKSVVMLDTCQSGLIPGRRGSGPDMDSVIKNLSEAEGMIFLSASRSNQAAQERPEWGHGAFTLAIKEALEQNKARDDDGDGAIDVGELYDYVGDRVFDLTRGEQKPNMSGRIENFPLYVIE